MRQLEKKGGEMINPGDFIFVDDKGRMFSKPKEGRY